MTNNSPERASRRKFVAAVGTAGVLGIAGCTSNEQTDAPAGGDTDGGEATEGGTPAAGDEETTTSGDGSSGRDLSGTIDIAGSSTVFPLATVMAERFREDHPDVRINIQSTGSGGGFANHFCPGNTDFNNASRPIQEEEMATCESNDVNPVELNVATDALTVIVNNDADWVDCITVEELKQIWGADDAPSTWSDVNSDWPDQELELYGPSDASGTYDYFNEAILGEEESHRQDYSGTEQDRTIIQGVQGSEAAMGYLGFAYYSENTDTVKALAVDDGDGCVEPSLETASAGEYTPLSRPLFTYPAQGALAEEHVAEFARFWMENATSTELVAEQVGYVPLTDDQQQEQMETLEAAIEEAQG